MDEQTTTHELNHSNSIWIVLVIVALMTIGAFVYGFLRVITLEQRVTLLDTSLSSTTAALSESKTLFAHDLALLRSETVGISQSLTDTKQDVELANNSISAVQDQVGGVKQTVGSISGTVSTLQKLSTIDPELLKKYSKVYFLNENYTPAHMKAIPQEYVYSNSKQEQFLEEAQPYLLNLLNAAKKDGVALYVSSGYRSFAQQESLKNVYKMTYGADTANTFSADQGYSEHQLGTAVDFITSGMGGQLSNSFEDSESFRWLTQNAHKYGYQLSYPAKNSYYVYEPWHWRFVGVKLATYLHDRGMSFYDMDQRDIDTYLANLFD